MFKTVDITEQMGYAFETTRWLTLLATPIELLSEADEEIIKGIPYNDPKAIEHGVEFWLRTSTPEYLLEKITEEYGEILTEIVNPNYDHEETACEVVDTLMNAHHLYYCYAKDRDAPLSVNLVLNNRNESLYEKLFHIDVEITKTLGRIAERNIISRGTKVKAVDLPLPAFYEKEAKELMQQILVLWETVCKDKGLSSDLKEAVNKKAARFRKRVGLINY